MEDVKKSINKKLLIAMVALVFSFLTMIGVVIGVYAATDQTVESGFSVKYSIGDNIAARIKTSFNDEVVTQSGVTDAEGYVVFNAGDQGRTVSLPLIDKELTPTEGMVWMGFTITFVIENLSTEMPLHYQITPTVVKNTNIEIAGYFGGGTCNNGEYYTATGDIKNSLIQPESYMTINVEFVIIDINKSAELLGDFSISLDKPSI